MAPHSTRVLIVRLGSLGDVVHAIPVVAALRAGAPDARIDWLVDPRYVELLGLVRGLDRIIPLDPRGGVGALIRTVRSLRTERYDVAVDLQGLLKSAVLARAAGAARTIGFPRAHLREPLARLFYTETPDPGPLTHVVFKNLALLRALGVVQPQVVFPLSIPRTPAAEQVREMFAGGPYAVINPGAAWPNKRWPPARFGAVASALRDRSGWRSLILWGPGEEPLAAAVVAASAGAAVVSPPTAVTDLVGIAQGARLMISGDTGPLHIGAAVGTPIVALFGPTLPERNGPWSAADVAVSRVDRCACVYERRCRLGTPCIDSISVEEIVTAAERRVSVHG